MVGEGWDLPPSSDGDESDHADASALVLAAPKRAARHGGSRLGSGRAVGGPEARATHQRVLQRLALADGAPNARAVQLAIARSCRKESERTPAPRWSQMLVTVGDPVLDLVVRESSVGAPGLLQVPTIKHLVTHFLGDTPRPAGPIMAECKALEMNRSVYMNNFSQLAAFAYYGSRAWVGTVVARARAAVASKRCKGLGTFRYSLYDETDIRCRAQDRQGADSGSETCDTADEYVAADEGKFRAESQNRKVVQTDGSVSMLLEDTTSKRMCAWICPLNCHLTCGDRATGEVLAACNVQSLRVPNFEEATEDFAFNSEGATADMAGSNARAESILGEAHHTSRFRVPCFVHRCSTSQGNSLTAVDDTVSGSIAICLLMRMGSAVGKLRDLFIAALIAGVNWVDGRAHHPTSPHMLRADLLYASSIGSVRTKANIVRVAQLKYFDNSDLSVDVSQATMGIT